MRVPSPSARGKRLTAIWMGAAALSACVLPLPSPQVDLPAPYEESGLRISVDGFYTRGRSYVGLTGSAKNVSGKDFALCMVSFDIVDSTGVKVGDAIAHSQGLKTGQEWRFQALFTTAFATTFKSIRPGRVTVMGTPEDMAADMQARLSAIQASPGVAGVSPPVAVPSNRTLGVFFAQRLPSGDFLPRITSITAGSRAAEAGWRIGDLIIAVDQVDVRTASDAVIATQRGAAEKTYTLQRGSDTFESSIKFTDS